VRPSQAAQKHSPDAIIQFETIDPEKRVMKVGFVRGGTTSGDSPHFRKHFWEVDTMDKRWAFQQGTVDTIADFGGRDLVLLWEDGKGELTARTGGGGATIAGRDAWNKCGVAITYMSGLKVTRYQGQIFENVICMLIPRNTADLPALWTFASSESFEPAVRSVNQKLSVDVRYFEKAPFDLTYWQAVAAEKYPNGLPKPYSDDPTQWLFDGHPADSTQPLHVAVARLLGYHWPRQTGSGFPDCPALGPDGLESFADEDGIVCLPPLNREQPAAARLRQLLTAALGAFDEHALIAAAGLKGSKSKTIEDWLRDEFFEQHAKLFHDRPFIWHIWDGRSDGFHALVNYHKLDYAMLQKLTYSYLGDWIRQQDEDARADKPGSAERLGATRALQTKLAAILEGEAPLDIFVRWKPLKDQAQGWHPDLNDGIRQNIRPFLFSGDVGKKGAGLFRAVPLKLNDKDRGTEPNRPKKDYPWFWCEEEPGTDPIGGETFIGTRWNDVHFTLARKQKASA